jgi:hypothetical protein
MKRTDDRENTQHLVDRRDESALQIKALIAEAHGVQKDLKATISEGKETGPGLLNQLA